MASGSINVDEAPDAQYSAYEMSKQGYLADVGLGDWANTTGAGGQRFNNILDYYRYRYGAGVTPETINEQTWYKTPNGINAPLAGTEALSYNPPTSTGAKLTLAAIAAMAGAGFMGGGGAGAGAAEGAGWTSGFDLAGGGALPQLAGSTAAVPSWTSGFDLPMGNVLQGGDTMLDMLRKGLVGKGNPDYLGIAGSLASGLIGMRSANKMQGVAERAAAMQDPFGSQRGQYQQQLAALMADPSKITSMPGYNAGLQAVERRMASQGYLGSGNMMTALSEYGGSFFDKEANRLAMLGGANIGPSGGGALVEGYGRSFDTLSKSLASMGFGAREIARIINGA